MPKKDKELSQKEAKEETTPRNLYQKLTLIQSEIKELIRTEENKGQKYKFFNELQVLNLLKPLLEKYQLTILVSDTEDKELIYEKVGNMYLVRYQKKCLLINSENPNEQLTHYFWALGQNNDPAKAKGSAETYAMKYFLSKLFLMPVKDEGDPDYRQVEEVSKVPEKEQKPLPTEKLTTQTKTIGMQQVEKLIDLFKQKTKGDKERQKEMQIKFLEDLDKLLNKRGIEGTTEPGNFRVRLAELNEEEYQWLWGWLVKVEEK
ncbi:MAG: single-stranded DNA-binding protein [Mycoplasmataceae bacterium RV_VA103A]|nr:MAG: single-stranded DNA-binding protein [Mycoplasmataceae bacterium RV_VA103A]KLL03739.1 MAG: single-stranded DNA-binding protein [Mycoplasmataceae bacterium RV_VA103A]